MPLRDGAVHEPLVFSAQHSHHTSYATGVQKFRTAGKTNFRRLFNFWPNADCYQLGRTTKSVPLGGIITEVLARLLLNRFGSRRVCVALDLISQSGLALCR